MTSYCARLDNGCAGQAGGRLQLGEAVVGVEQHPLLQIRQGQRFSQPHAAVFVGEDHLVDADAQKNIAMPARLGQADHAGDAQALQVCRDQRTGLEIVVDADDHRAKGGDVHLLQRVFVGGIQGHG